MKIIILGFVALALVGCGQSGSSGSSPTPQVSSNGQIVVPATPAPEPVQKPACGTILACEHQCYAWYPWVDDKVIDRQDAANGMYNSGAHTKHIEENHARLASYNACLDLPVDEVLPSYH